jgi:hypothetical protein
MKNGQSLFLKEIYLFIEMEKHIDDSRYIEKFVSIRIQQILQLILMFQARSRKISGARPE